MKEQETATTSKYLDYKAIEDLVVDNPDLERLEMLLDQFNMFEAIGAMWHEARHSDMLAFLLNPQQNHRLGDVFARRLLQRALKSGEARATPVTPIDLDVWDLDQLIVLRDSQRIDILMIDERHRMTIILDNRLTSSGTAQQLARAWEAVQQRYPGWDVLGIYLTPDREPPPDERYISLDYGEIGTLLDELVESRSATLETDVGIMIIHYIEMLRRHIVGESEITKLCRRIYGKHQRAFDLIYEHRLSRQKAIRNVTKLLIEQKQDLVLDHTQERYTGFGVLEWDVPTLMGGVAGSTGRPGRILVFEFDTWQDTLPLRLHIGPCSLDVRQRLLEMANANQPPFKVSEVTVPGNDWTTIFERTFLSPEFYEEASTDELAERIFQHWAEFLKNDLPRMSGILKEQSWIWR